MFTEIKKYALINAKLRARISTILTDDFFANLIKCQSITEMLQLLRSTTFSELPDIYERTGDLKMVELELFKKEATILTDIEQHLPFEVLPLVRAYNMGYEIENCKNALRIFFDHTVRQRPIDVSRHYLLRENMVHKIPFDAIINSTSFDEVVDLLSSTPYGPIIKKEIPKVESRQSLFPLSNALDRYYYSRVLEEANALSSRDRPIALRLIGIEIDLQNINWIIRFRTFYNLPFETIVGLIIPGGLTIKGNALQDIFRSQQISVPLHSMIKNHYPGIAPLLSRELPKQQSQLTLIERILEMILLEEMHRIKRGYPFTIGIVLAYHIAKRHEIRRIITVLNAGLLNINRERTVGFI